MSKTDQTYKSSILAALHETASELSEAQLMGKQTMRRFDELCLTPVARLSAEEIRELRQRERGEKSPSGG